MQTSLTVAPQAQLDSSSLLTLEVLEPKQKKGVIVCSAQTNTDPSSICWGGHSPWPLEGNPGTCHGGWWACAAGCQRRALLVPWSSAGWSDLRVPTRCLFPHPRCRDKARILMIQKSDFRNISFYELPTLVPGNTYGWKGINRSKELWKPSYQPPLWFHCSPSHVAPVWCEWPWRRQHGRGCQPGWWHWWWKAAWSPGSWCLWWCPSHTQPTAAEKQKVEILVTGVRCQPPL